MTTDLEMNARENENILIQTTILDQKEIGQTTGLFSSLFFNTYQGNTDLLEIAALHQNEGK